MFQNKFIFLCLFIGSTIGGYIPLLWGDNFLSMTSVLFSGVGGLAGIYIGYSLQQKIS